jgi:SAM-dependent methyltransferase
MIRTFLSANKNASRKLKQAFPAVFVGGDGHAELNARIQRDIARLPAHTVLECGGIDRPLLRKSEVETYVGLDIEERATCYDVYHQFLVQSVESPIPVTADMVISTTLLEHVRDTDAAFREMRGALRPGGTMHHYIPCKWHPYAIALRLVGWRLQNALIKILRPDSVGNTGYRTFFDNCSPGGIERALRHQGYKNIDIKPYYHATEYFDFFLPLFALVGLFEKTCEVTGLRFFACGVVVSAEK